MKIHLHGHFNETGMGRHAESVHTHLLRLAEGRFSVGHTAPDDKDAIIKMVLAQQEDDVIIFFVMQNPEFLNFIKNKKILWMVFESTRIPSKWLENLALYDAIWVPSRWGYDVLVACGVPAEKVRVMPEGVDTKAYTPKPVPHEKFTFLSVGKYEKRKGINELIMAFVQEFPRADYPDIILRLKADFPMFPELIQKLRSNTEFDDRIEILEGDWTDEQIIALYNGADAFAFPSRSEGFGLPCIEAIACGLPVLATTYSGQTEYLKEIENLYIPIAYEMEDIEDFLYDHFYKEFYAGEPYGQWAKPDVGSIRKGLRQIYENHDAWKEKAATASKIIREKFDWAHAAERVMKTLNIPEDHGCADATARLDSAPNGRTA